MRAITKVGHLLLNRSRQCFYPGESSPESLSETPQGLKYCLIVLKKSCSGALCWGHYVCSHTEFHSALHFKTLYSKCVCVCGAGVGVWVYLLSQANKSWSISRKIFITPLVQNMSVASCFSSKCTFFSQLHKWNNIEITDAFFLLCRLYVSNCCKLSGLDGHRIQLKVTHIPSALLE